MLSITFLVGYLIHFEFSGGAACVGAKNGRDESNFEWWWPMAERIFWHIIDVSRVSCWLGNGLLTNSGEHLLNFRWSWQSVHLSSSRGQPTPFDTTSTLFYFSANQTTFDNFIPSNFNSALVRLDISQNTILEQPCPFTPYHRTTTTPLNSLLSYFYSVVSLLFDFHSTIHTTTAILLILLLVVVELVSSVATTLPS